MGPGAVEVMIVLADPTDTAASIGATPACRVGDAGLCRGPVVELDARHELFRGVMDDGDFADARLSAADIRALLA